MKGRNVKGRLLSSLSFGSMQVSALQFAKYRPFLPPMSFLTFASLTTFSSLEVIAKKYRLEKNLSLTPLRR